MKPTIKDRLANIIAKLAGSPDYESGIEPKTPLEFYLNEAVDKIVDGVITPVGIVIATGKMTQEEAQQTRANIGAGTPLTPEQIATGAGAWLSENLATPSTPPVDASLSVANAAADAKETGDSINQIKSAIIFSEKCIKYGSQEMILNERLNLSNGAIVTNSNNQARTDYIPVQVGDYLQTCAIRNICLYDAQYNYLGYINLWTSNDTVAPPSTWSGNYRSNLTQVQSINNVDPAYIRCWGVYNQYPPAISILSTEPYKVLNLGDSIFGNNEKPWDIGTYIQNIALLKTANCAYGGTTARVIPSGNMSPLGLPSITDCITSEDFSPLQTPAYWASKSEYLYTVPTLLLNLVDFEQLEIITLAYGLNDYQGNTPLDNSTNKLDTSTYKGGLRYAIDNILAKYPHLTLVLFSPLYRYWSNASDYSTVDEDTDTKLNSLGLKLTDYVEAMKEVAEEYHLPFFENYNSSGLNMFTAPTWLRDSAHLVRTIGVDKIGHLIGNEIKAIY